MIHRPHHQSRRLLDAQVTQVNSDVGTLCTSVTRRGKVGGRDEKNQSSSCFSSRKNTFSSASPQTQTPRSGPSVTGPSAEGESSTQVRRFKQSREEGGRKPGLGRDQEKDEDKRGPGVSARHIHMPSPPQHFSPRLVVLSSSRPKKKGNAIAGMTGRHVDGDRERVCLSACVVGKKLVGV